MEGWREGGEGSARGERDEEESGGEKEEEEERKSCSSGAGQEGPEAQLRDGGPFIVVGE